MAERRDILLSLPLDSVDRQALQLGKSAIVPCRLMHAELELGVPPCH
jgi:hypothetical protein